LTSDIQSSLKELENLHDRLMTFNFYFQQFIISPESELMFFAVPSNIPADKTEPIIDIIFESMVLTLSKFYELQPQLVKYVYQQGQKKLLESLKDPWKIINAGRSRINLWRNRIVAHSGEQSVNYTHYTKIDPAYNNTRIAVVTISRYVVLYIWAILGNIQKQYFTASDALAEERASAEGLEGIRILEKAAESEIVFSHVINRCLRSKKLRFVNFRGYNEWPMGLIVKDVAKIRRPNIIEI
jgi:hypothetical protein